MERETFCDLIDPTKFLEIYREWHERQRNEIRTFMETNPSVKEIPKGLVRIILPYYKGHPDLRLTIQSLVHHDPLVIAFRKQQHEEIINHITYIFWTYGQKVPSQVALYAFILNFENLCDAFVAGKFTDAGFTDAEAVQSIEDLVAGLFSKWKIPTS